MGKPDMDNAALLYVDETYAINQCVYDVFDSLPRYAEESLYQEAMEIALARDEGSELFDAAH